MSGESKRAAARQRIAEKRAAEAAARAAAERRRRTVVGGVTAALVLVLVLVVVVVVQTRRTSTALDAAAPAGTVAGGTAFAVGEADAPVTLTVYTDYQCPVCQRFEETNGDTLDQLVADGQVLLEQRPIAILDRFSTTDYSTRALNAAAVVADQAGTGAFDQFSDLLFADQPAEGGAGLSDDQLVGYAAQAGATGEAVEQGIRDLRFEDWTAQVTEAASRAGVTGTPTVLVDGEPLDNGSQLTPEGITAAVEAAARG
ncbi:DsbA family protein [Modestobacter versicolor]|uniref:DsbA family protein n=1 Tax=Modestobacter versicolor TaxID=429133 RepID=UPI0034DF899B